MPRLRGQGVGTWVLRTLAAEARRRGCWRLQWQSLTDNDSANGFYEKRVGASRQDQLFDWRLAGPALQHFAQHGRVSGAGNAAG